MSLLDPYLIVKRSKLPGCGKGLFTKIFIPKGMLITEHTGKITRFKDAKSDFNNLYIFYVSINHVIDAREQHDALARFANDARGPKKIVGFTNNSKYIVIDKRVFIYAMKDIMPANEIFVGYGNEYWETMKENNKVC